MPPSKTADSSNGYIATQVLAQPQSAASIQLRMASEAIVGNRMFDESSPDWDDQSHKCCKVRQANTTVAHHRMLLRSSDIVKYVCTDAQGLQLSLAQLTERVTACSRWSILMPEGSVDWQHIRETGQKFTDLEKKRS